MIADVVDNRITLTGEEYELRAAKTLVPGCKWDRKAHTWHVPLTWASCQALRGVFADQLTIGPELLQWAGNHKALIVDLAAEIAGAQDWSHPELSEKLYPYQRVGVAFLTEIGRVLLADEMGTGKTVQGVNALTFLDGGGVTSAYPALIVCPKSVMGSWKRELTNWAPHLTVALARGSAKQRTEAILSGADVVIINWDNLRNHSRLERFGSMRLLKCEACDPHREDTTSTARCESHEGDLNKVAWSVVIADEAHRAKDPKAKQTRALKAVGGNYRWALSGTPLPNKPDDLWSVMNWVSPEEFPSRSTFIDRYCLTAYVPYGSGVEVVGVSPATKDELFRFLDPHMLRRLKEQVLPWLPDKVYSVREIELSGAAAKVYKDLAKESMARLDDGSLLIGDNDLSLFTRLRQAANATLAFDGEEVILKDPSAKLDELELVIEEMGGKSLVVFSDQRKLLELAEKRLTKKGIRWVSIHGGVSGPDRDAAEWAFQEGKAQVIFISLAGAEGLTLTAADTIVLLNRPLSLKDSAQVEDRIHRPGAEAHSSVNIIDIVATGTIDERIREALVEKQITVEEVLRDTERMRGWLT